MARGLMALRGLHAPTFATFLVAVVYRAMVYFGKHKDTDHEKVALSEVLPTLKSGDVILFIAHTHGFTNSIFTGDLYSHSGMVVRDPEGGLRLSEATSSGSSEDPLIPRLQNYRGMLFLMQLDRPLTAEPQRTLQEKASMRTPYPNFVQLVRSWPLQPRAPRGHTGERHSGGWATWTPPLRPRRGNSGSGTAPTPYFRRPWTPCPPGRAKQKQQKQKRSSQPHRPLPSPQRDSRNSITRERCLWRRLR